MGEISDVGKWMVNGTFSGDPAVAKRNSLSSSSDDNYVAKLGGEKELHPILKVSAL